jgi:thiol-disulfide isomerase/thioredoxin
MRKIFYLLFICCAISCSKEEVLKLKSGSYKATLLVQDNQELPFLFEVKNETLITIHNAQEEIIVDEITYFKDSIRIQTPVFEGYIKAKITKTGLVGSFIKPSLNRVVPFKAEKNTRRFTSKSDALFNITGNWHTIFSQDSKTDRYIAKGVFNQTGNIVTGTFRTTTGDYRYLEGIVDGDSLKLSTFDGAHAFLFTAKITDSTLVGNFYSGNHWKEPFIATLNNDYELPSANELTYIKKGYDKFAFSFPDKNGKVISLTDKRYQNKVTLVQIMGTWCPNCLDESKYYSQFYKQYKNKGLEIVALAFEYTKTKEKAFEGINRLQKRIDIPYPILLAQYKTENKTLAREKLPMLNHIISYPTTVFIDKKGTVRKIHTGFNGPATGQKFIDYKNEFETFVKQLLQE